MFILRLFLPAFSFFNGYSLKTSSARTAVLFSNRLPSPSFSSHLFLSASAFQRALPSFSLINWGVGSSKAHGAPFSDSLRGPAAGSGAQHSPAPSRWATHLRQGVQELQGPKGFHWTHLHGAHTPHRKGMGSCLLKVTAKSPCSPPPESKPAFSQD